MSEWVQNNGKPVVVEGSGVDRNPLLERLIAAETTIGKLRDRLVLVEQKVNGQDPPPQISR